MYVKLYIIWCQHACFCYASWILLPLDFSSGEKFCFRDELLSSNFVYVALYPKASFSCATLFLRKDMHFLLCKWSLMKPKELSHQDGISISHKEAIMEQYTCMEHNLWILWLAHAHSNLMKHHSVSCAYLITGHWVLCFQCLFIGFKYFYCRLVEEADYKSTTELFGKRGDEKTLDNFIPKSEGDFAEYAELISHKLRPYEVCWICSGYDFTLLYDLLTPDSVLQPNWVDCRKATIILVCSKL